MNSRRTVILIVAVVIGAFAAIGLMNYVRNVENGAGDANAISQVWVVKAPIPKGTPAETAIEQNLFGLEDAAQGLIPPTAISDPSTELVGLVAIADLDVNMPVVGGFFASPAVLKTGIADRLEERGLVTVSFNVDQARGAAFLIEPGDHVNVLTERPWDTPFWLQDPEIPISDRSTAELSSILSATDTERPVLNDLYAVDVRYVYQNAEVLAVGSSLVPEIGQDTLVDEEADQGSRGLITLAVTPEAALTILAVGRDNIYLSLVPFDYEPRPIQPADPTRQVLPGERADILTPYADAKAAGFASSVSSDDGARIGSTPNPPTDTPESDGAGDSAVDDSEAGVGEDEEDANAEGE